MDEPEDRPESGRVRKRTSNACLRCRRQKIKCSGTAPCEQCSRRSVHCVFDSRQQKILVSQDYIAQLERRAAERNQQGAQDNRELDTEHDEGVADPGASHPRNLRSSLTQPADDGDVGFTAPPSINGLDEDPETESQESQRDALHATPEPGLRNPLDADSFDSFAVNTSIADDQDYLGTTSNWSFGLRVLKMVHERVHSAPLPLDNLLFEGSTYDLGWDGSRKPYDSALPCLPTSDFALFLINAVKFHTGRLFHLFDEPSFMRNFALFYENPTDERHTKSLWFIHFLIILAFGKAFVGSSATKSKRPPGADLFVQAMQRLPDIVFLQKNPLSAIEILSCAALYLQCLDLRSAAYNVIGQALRLAIEQGMHTDMRSHHLSGSAIQRCREVWWTVYILDRQMTSLMGLPVGLSDDDITAPLPVSIGTDRKMLAIKLHVELSKANAVILQTVYSNSSSKRERFVPNIKAALKVVAGTSDERNRYFPLDLSESGNSICRLSAYLHIFHHQALIVATRPLLYSFLQKRLEARQSLRISSSGGARSLLRVCVSSARRCLTILDTLQSQSLLESFLPFDLEATFSSAIVLSIASAVDPSLIRDRDARISTAHKILEEMAWRGNLIAGFHQSELDQLDSNIQKLVAEHNRFRSSNDMLKSQNAAPNDTDQPHLNLDALQSSIDDQIPSDLNSIDTILSEWNSEDGLNGDQLIAMANSLEFGQLSWPAVGDFEQFLNANS